MFKYDNDIFTSAVLDAKDEAYKIAYGYLKNEQESMDAVSLAIEKSFKNLRKLKNHNLFKTWFIRIVINECKMVLRRNSKIVVMNDDLLDVHNIEDNSFRDINIEEKLDLEGILGKLNPDERILIYMKYYMGYTLSDIATILEIPEGTVKSKIYNIIKILKQRLEGY